jgi:hypothetical protein
VEFLSQTTDDCLGGHHLAVDHLKQLHRVDAQFSAKPEDVGAPSRAQSANMPTKPSALAFGVSMNPALEAIEELSMN